MSTSFRLATYNILHGTYPKEITKSIQKLVKDGASIIALQEFVRPEQEHTLKTLGPDWKLKYLLQNPGNHLGVGFLWDSSKITLSNIEEISLPRIQKIDWIGRLRKVQKPIPRSAITAQAIISNKLLRITNLHFDWYGGHKHRIQQLKYLLARLNEKEVISQEIICGDFNTLLPSFLVHKEEKLIEKTLGNEYKNIFPQLSWSCDTSRTDSPEIDRLANIYKILGKIGIRLRFRSDYMFAKGISTNNPTFYSTLDGSDHRPLAVDFLL